MPGFFTSDQMDSVAAPTKTEAQCGACGLFKGCETPKMKPRGYGKKKILIIGESPSEEDDEVGKQFTGDVGALLKDAGVKMKKNCIATNTLICHPPKGRAAKDKEVLYCKPNLTKLLDEYKPEVIIPMGHAATKAIIGRVWRESVGAMERWQGWQIPCQELNAWICPVADPQDVLKATGRGRPVIERD